MQVAMMLACTAAYAGEPQERADAAANTVLPTVTVGAMRNPVDKSYRKMLKGMDLFEEKRSMAPNASLRYKLLPRQRDTNMDGIELNIIADTVTIPVPVASDHTFTLERHQNALAEDASVIPNRKVLSMTWRTEIRTPGLPPNTRRLGDLRLECHVGMEAGLISNTLPVIGQIVNFLQQMRDFCNGSDVPYLFFAERPLFSVTMVAGTRREILSVDGLYAGVSFGRTSKADLAYCDCQVLLARTYFLPLGDRSWPDDTLVEFEYMDDGNDRQAAVPPSNTISARNARDAITIEKSTRAEVIAALGKTTVISFDSGFEVWVYQIKGDRVTGETAAKASWWERFAHAGSEKGTLGKTEFVVLFAPSGVVTKTRIRPAPPSSDAKRT